jgi:hypothetical protein
MAGCGVNGKAEYLGCRSESSKTPNSQTADCHLSSTLTIAHPSPQLHFYALSPQLFGMLSLKEHPYLNSPCEDVQMSYEESQLRRAAVTHFQIRPPQ